MMEKVRSPALRVSVQSCSPSLTTEGAVAPVGGVSSDRTAGWGVPEALPLILTRSSKAGLAAGAGAAAGGAWAGKSDEPEQGALGDAEGNGGIVRFGAQGQGFGQPDFAPGARGAVDAESLGLNRGCVGGGQTGRGCGHGFQLIVLSERRERKHEENKGTEDRAVDHGNPGAELWSGRPDSNRRHRPWQGRTLPAELLPPSVKLYFYAET